MHIAVKEVVATQAAAQAEVERLNTLNGNKGCKYYWVTTRLVGFEVTDPDAPDGSLLFLPDRGGWYERHGMRWEPSATADDFIAKWREANPKELAKHPGKYVAIRICDGAVLATGDTLGSVAQCTKGILDEIVYDMLPR